MEETWEYPALTPQKYKALWLFAALTIVGAIMLRLIFDPGKYKTVSFRYDNFDWAMLDSEWVNLDGSYRFITTLTPQARDRKIARFSLDQKSWVPLCGAILSDLEKVTSRPKDVKSRKDIFRVTFVIKDGAGEIVTKRPVAVSVENGACKLFVSDRFVETYPNEMQGWFPTKFAAKKHAARDGKPTTKELIVTFKWAGEDQQALDTFPAAKACEYLVDDPFFEITKYVGKAAEEDQKVDQLKVQAFKGVDIGLFKAGRTLGDRFNIVNGVCVPITTGDET